MQKLDIFMAEPSNQNIQAGAYQRMFWGRGKVTNGAGTAFSPVALDHARANRAQVVVKLHIGTEAIAAAGGGLDLGKLEEQLLLFTGQIEGYIADGTIAGHLVVDEPQDKSEWNGMSPTAEDCAAACALSRAYWPTLPTMVNTVPDFAAMAGDWAGVDNLWFFYANHKGDLDAFIEAGAALVGASGINEVSWGIQAMKGGDGGAPMTPARVAEVGRAMWRTRVSDTLFFSRDDPALLSPEMLDAMGIFGQL